MIRIKMRYDLGGGSEEDELDALGESTIWRSECVIFFIFFLRGDFVLLSEIEISVIWDLSEAEERKVRKKDLEKSLLIWRK